MFSKLRHWFRFHVFALAATLVVAVLSGSFFWFLDRAARENDSTYYPVAMRGEFDEVYYAARAANVYYHGVGSGEVVTREHAGSPSPLPMLNPIIIGAAGKLAGSLDRGIVLVQTVFPAITFFLVYLVAFELCRNRALALGFGLIFMIMPRFGLWPSDGSIDLFGDPRRLYFSRIDYPAVTYPFFAFALYLFARLICRREDRAGLSFGLLFGVLFYTYLYDWVYLGVAVDLAILFALFRRDWWLLKQLLIGSLLALTISVPYWLNIIAVHGLESYADILLRLGAEFDRSVRVDIVWFSYIRVVLLTFLIWFLYRRNQKHVPVVMGALLLPVFIILNLQLISNVVPQPDHWHRTTFLAVSLAVFLIVVAIFERAKWQAIFRKSLLVASFVLILLGFSIQYRSAAESLSAYTIDPSYLAAYEWIREHTDPFSVVGALSGQTNDEITIFTGNPVFLPNGFHTVASTEEIWRRAMVLARLSALTAESFGHYIQSESTYLFNDYYRDHSFNSYFKTGDRSVPATVVDSMVRLYQKIDTSKIHYDLDILIVGPREVSLGSKGQFLNLKPVYNNRGITLYQR
jgi:hypothetical protein